MDLHPIVDAVAAETVSAVYGYGIDYSLPAACLPACLPARRTVTVAQAVAGPVVVAVVLAGLRPNLEAGDWHAPLVDAE